MSLQSYQKQKPLKNKDIFHNLPRTSEQNLNGSPNAKTIARQQRNFGRYQACEYNNFTEGEEKKIHLILENNERNDLKMLRMIEGSGATS